MVVQHYHRQQTGKVVIKFSKNQDLPPYLSTSAWFLHSSCHASEAGTTHIRQPSTREGSPMHVSSNHSKPLASEVNQSVSAATHRSRHELVFIKEKRATSSTDPHNKHSTSHALVTNRKQQECGFKSHLEEDATFSPTV